MNTILISFVLISVVTSFLSIIFFFKNKKLKNKNKLLTETVSNFNEKIKQLDKPLKNNGYYIINLVQNDTKKFKARIYVNELDKYTNGTSKIELSNIEFFDVKNDDIDLRSAERFIKNGFSSIINSSDVEWLESLDSIKKIRKSKIEEIKKSIS